MYTITLSSEEQQTLVNILECCVSDLRSQIVHTDHYAYKKMLKDKRQTVQTILDGLNKLGDAELIQSPA